MRPAYLIALLLVLAMGFWMAGRADPALARWGMNRGECFQALTGSYYCGAQATRIEYLTGSGERRRIPGVIN